VPFRPTAADNTTAGPSIAWLAVGLLLAGLGTVLLGPILPAISLRWHLTDSQTGPLFFAKFVGSFIGGISVPRKLRWGIFSGTILSCLGFAAFGLSTGLLTGSLTLFVAGIGLGQIIASSNILAGYRYRRQTGSALSSLNFFFSLGAVATGLIVASFEPRFGLQSLLLWLGAAFLTTGIGGRLGWITPNPDVRNLSHLEIEKQPLAESSPLPNPNPDPRTHPLDTHSFLRFALFLFLYGGLETCLAGWLTTYTLRYSDAHLIGGQSAVVLLLAALTTGRALSSIALRYIREITMQRLGLALSFLFIAALSTSHHAASLSLWSILLGLSLAPFFPATFALLMHRNPTPRVAGFILAVSGLGAAAFPWLMGVVSTHTGSLRTAMSVPMSLALLLLAVSFTGKNHSTTA
jgi:FHS family glucose/mannose:H+ symporter-like MFS transporter